MGSECVIIAYLKSQAFQLTNVHIQVINNLKQWVAGHVHLQCGTVPTEGIQFLNSMFPNQPVQLRVSMAG